MRVAQAPRAGTGRAAARIARDVVAIAALAAERVSLHREERKQRRARSTASAAESAREVRWNATWAAAAIGAVASVPSGPVFGVAAAALEGGLLVEVESRATETLLAIVSGNDSRAVPGGWGRDARRTRFRAGAQKAAILIAEQATRAGARIALKELGVVLPRLGLRAVLGPAAPVVGAVWSAAWNALEMHRRLTPAVDAVDQACAEAARACAAPVAALAPPAAAPASMLHARAAARDEEGAEDLRVARVA